MLAGDYAVQNLSMDPVPQEPEVKPIPHWLMQL